MCGRFRTSCTRAALGAAGRDDLVRHDRRSACGVQRLRGRLAWQPQRAATAAGCNAADGGRIAAVFDDRQRVWRHLLHLRGESSTALVSARLGGRNVAECADPPSELKCRMEAPQVDRETAESVGGVARPLRRAAALIWVRADQESPRSPAAVLIILRLLGWCRGNPGCLSACTESEGDDHYGELDN
jgi:hypothetical protein